MLTSLVVLQPLNLCNLNCSYCYLHGRKLPGVMNEQVTEDVFRKLFAHPDLLNDPLTIVWHAGEPLLAGIEFYRHAASVIELYKPPGLRVKHQIQTNGTQISNAWCDLFQQTGITVSVSLDGPKFIHDRHRVDWKGRGSFDRVMGGIALLRDRGIAPRGIAVLSDFSLDFPKEIFAFFAENGFSYLSLNVEEVDGDHKISSLGSMLKPGQLAHSEERFESFMDELFDCWYASDRSMGVREIDLAISSIRFRAEYPNEFMPSAETTGLAILAISRTGQISTFSPELAPSFASGSTDYVIGNVSDISGIGDLVDRPSLKHLAEQIHAGTRRCAATCPDFDICGGGSPSNKLFELGTFDAAETSFCRLHTRTLVKTIENNLEMRLLPMGMKSKH